MQNNIRACFWCGSIIYQILNKPPQSRMKEGHLVKDKATFTMRSSPTHRTRPGVGKLPALRPTAIPYPY